LAVDRDSGFAQVSGARLHYEVWRNELAVATEDLGTDATPTSGEPLVLIHAGIADGRMWDRQLDVFAGRRRTVRYDMRGFGGSKVAERVPYSHHEDLRGLLDVLDVGRALLVGCSMGAKTAIDFALELPERTRALVLVGPTVGGFELAVDPPQELDELVAAEEADDLERLSELEVRVWVDGPYRDPGSVDPAVRDLVLDMNLIALKNEASGVGDERPLEQPAVNKLPEIRVPTLVVVGDLDRPETVASADLLEERLPNARKVVMPGTAHLPNMERPEDFNRIVLGFLDELDG
jgi:2-hydroxy-6-oxonona-2,4-dienedioate hydrolase